MFTLKRMTAGLSLALFGWVLAMEFAAQSTQYFFAPGFHQIAAAIGLVVGWTFLGRNLGGRLLSTLWFTAQAIVLVAVIAAGIFAIRDGALNGTRRFRRDPIDAVMGMFDKLVEFLLATLQFDFMITAGFGVLVTGVFVHIAAAIIERRRNAR